MSADPVPMLLDWLGQLLKEHGLIEEQREESGYDPDYDTGDPPDCFDPTAWEIVLAAIECSLPDESVSEDELRAFLAVRSYERRAKPVLGDKLRPARKHKEHDDISRRLGKFDLQAFADRLREESWRKPLQDHAAWLAEFCKLVDPQAKQVPRRVGFHGPEGLAELLSIPEGKREAFCRALRRMHGEFRLDPDDFRETNDRRKNRASIEFNGDSAQIRTLAEKYKRDA